MQVTNRRLSSDNPVSDIAGVPYSRDAIASDDRQLTRPRQVSYALDCWSVRFRLQYGDPSARWFILLFPIFVQGSVVLAMPPYAGGADWRGAYLGLATPAIGLAIATGSISL